MTLHDDRHEDWLVQKLAGEPLDAVARQEIESCMECRRTIGELPEIQAALDAAGRHERGAARRAFETTRADTPPIPLSRRATAMRAAAAVILATTAGIYWRSTRPTEPPADVGLRLGSGDFTDLAPAGVVSRSSFAGFSFRFLGDRQASDRFQVLVYDRDNSEAPPLTSELLAETTWIPSAEQIAQLPEDARWEVRLVDGNRTLSSGEESVRLVP